MAEDAEDLEQAACTPVPLNGEGFNAEVKLPYGLHINHLAKAMSEFLDFLGFLNGQLHARQLVRLECLLMPANFSSLVGEFQGGSIPKYCASLVRNRYHNGYPDLLPAEHPGQTAQRHDQGIEIKASRYESGWQGHNVEDGWFLIFMFDSNRPIDLGTGASPRPFRFLGVVAGLLEKADWAFSGRSETSRRTITASVTKAGRMKLTENWAYKDPIVPNLPISLL